jgi:hypothetical protein
MGDGLQTIHQYLLLHREYHFQDKRHQYRQLRDHYGHMWILKKQKNVGNR